MGEKIKWKKHIRRILIIFTIGFFLPELLMVLFIPLGLVVGEKSARDKIRNAFNYFKPIVFSETQIKNVIEENLPIDIPTDATNLYYAWEGVLDIDYSVALTLPTQESCQNFFEKQLKMSSEVFKKDELSNESLQYDKPSYWPEKYEGNWELEKYENSLFCYYDRHTSQEDRGVSVLYFPDDNRIFIIVDNPFAFEYFFEEEEE